MTHTCPGCGAAVETEEYSCGARRVRTGPNTYRTSPCGDRGRIKSTGQIALPLADQQARPDRDNQTTPRRTR
jgi:hypothetical protein